MNDKIFKESETYETLINLLEFKNERVSFDYITEFFHNPTKIDEYKYIFDFCNEYIFNSNIMIILGYMYYVPKYVTRDYYKAIELYDKAIELNNSNAMLDLAFIYWHGCGIKQNTDKSVELYNKAIKLGSTEAMYSLAYKYTYDQPIKHQIKLNCKAIKLFIKSNKKNGVENILKIIKAYPKILLEKIIKINFLQNKINELGTYVIHLETSPFSQEYEKHMKNFNDLVNKTNQNQ